MTMVITSTEWENFFYQRCNSKADPHIAKIATMMRDEFDKSHPNVVKQDEFHLPYIRPDEIYSDYNLIHLSVARCARTSYGNQNDVRSYDEDSRLYKRLVSGETLVPVRTCRDTLC